VIAAGEIGCWVAGLEHFASPSIASGTEDDTSPARPSPCIGFDTLTMRGPMATV
jgi:hypothetical protein